MNTLIDILFTLLTFVVGGLVLHRAYEPIDDPCTFTDAMTASDDGSTLLSGFENKCSESDDLTTCVQFKLLSEKCGQCLIESVSQLEDNTACFKGYWKEGTDSPCMKAVNKNFYLDCFSPTTAITFQALHSTGLLPSEQI
jgi:hypothetical protein